MRHPPIVTVNFFRLLFGQPILNAAEYRAQCARLDSRRARKSARRPTPISRPSLLS